jgi:hypothetical protein
VDAESIRFNPAMFKIEHLTHLALNQRRSGRSKKECTLKKHTVPVVIPGAYSDNRPSNSAALRVIRQNGLPENEKYCTRWNWGQRSTPFNFIAGRLCERWTRGALAPRKDIADCSGAIGARTQDLSSLVMISTVVFAILVRREKPGCVQSRVRATHAAG